MSFLSKFMSFFPTSFYLYNMMAVIHFILNPGIISFLLILFFLYLYPIVSFRLINIFFPLKEGAYNILEKKYNPWWGSHMMQIMYMSHPGLEAALRTIPGMYSFWLRLWGSKVGKGVYWTPNIEIDDRSLIEIGDNCLVGHKLHFIPHIITPRDGIMSLYVKKIKIGKSCFLGAGSRLGPGVTMDDNTSIPILTDGQINQHFESGNHIKTK